MSPYTSRCEYGLKRENAPRCKLFGLEYFDSNDCKSTGDFCAGLGYTNQACASDERKAAYCPQNMTYHICEKDPDKYCPMLGYYREGLCPNQYYTQYTPGNPLYSTANHLCNTMVNGEVVYFDGYYRCASNCKAQIYRLGYRPISSAETLWHNADQKILAVIGRANIPTGTGFDYGKYTKIVGPQYFSTQTECYNPNSGRPEIKGLPEPYSRPEDQETKPCVNLRTLATGTHSNSADNEKFSALIVTSTQAPQFLAKDLENIAVILDTHEQAGEVNFFVTETVGNATNGNWLKWKNVSFVDINPPSTPSTAINAVSHIVSDEQSPEFYYLENTAILHFINKQLSMSGENYFCAQLDATTLNNSTPTENQNISSNIFHVGPNSLVQLVNGNKAYTYMQVPLFIRGANAAAGFRAPTSAAQGRVVANGGTLLEGGGRLWLLGSHGAMYTTRITAINGSLGVAVLDGAKLVNTGDLFIYDSALLVATESSTNNPSAYIQKRYGLGRFGGQFTRLCRNTGNGKSGMICIAANAFYDAPEAFTGSGVCPSYSTNLYPHNTSFKLFANHSGIACRNLHYQNVRCNNSDHTGWYMNVQYDPWSTNCRDDVYPKGQSERPNFLTGGH